MSIFYLIIGFVLLVAGGEFLVRSSVGLSLKLNLSKMIIGLTVVSFATSAPELIVSVQSALDGFSGFALGNVIGSNIANIAFVLGTTALIAPLAIDKDFFKFNWPWMMAFSILLYVLLLSGNNLVRWEGAVLLGSIVIFLVLLIIRAHKNKETLRVDEELQESVWWKIILFFILGGIALWQGSVLLVEAAVEIAASLGIPESIIAVSMVALGTSVPELAASIIAALKKEKAISLGNLIGSNIFNLLWVLGLSAVISPMKYSPTINSDIVVLLLATALILFSLMTGKAKNQIGKPTGILFLTAYIGYLVFVVMRG